MTNTKTILLTESGDLEVYEGKSPERQSVDNRDWDAAELYEANYESRLKSWLSTKQTVKIKYSEFIKLTNYLHNQNHVPFYYPVDVSDIVYEHEGLGYFKEPVVEEEPQHILWGEVLKMIENNNAAHLMRFYTIKRK